MTRSGRTARRLLAAGCGVTAVLLAAGVGMPLLAQGGGQTVHAGPAPRIDPPTTIDWPQHNLNLHNTRFAEPDGIDTSNVGRLELKWRHQTPPRSIVRSTTPLVVDGIMYFNSGSVLTALDAATGEAVWTFEADPPFSGGGRGPSYADGRIYAFGPTIMYAVDAKTGELVETFGDGGHLQVAQRGAHVQVPRHLPPHGRHDRPGVCDDQPADRGGRQPLHRPALLRGARTRRPADGRRRDDRRRALGVQHRAAGSAGRRLGDREGHLERRQALRRRRLDAAGNR